MDFIVRENIARTPVSMRVPATLAQCVENYAAKHDLRKTDAYVFFLRRGIEAEIGEGGENQLEEIREKLDLVLSELDAMKLAGAARN